MVYQFFSTGYETSNWQQNKYDKNHVTALVNIGDNCWIGANAIILQGVTIAEGCIIASGSIVTKSLNEKRTLYAGNPSKKIKN